MKNYAQAGRILSLPITTPRVPAGGGKAWGSLFGVAVADVEENSTGEFLTEGVVVLRTTAAKVELGDRVKWNGTAILKAAAGDDGIGVALEGNDSSAADIKVKLVPTTGNTTAG